MGQAKQINQPKLWQKCIGQSVTDNPNTTNDDLPSDAPVAEDKLEAGLYVTATPIGNSRDISIRGLDVLRRADVIACEDTRVTSKLLAIHNIRTSLLAYHDHNGDKLRPIIKQRIEKGEAVALVSDAGTPLISDPGFKLVRDLKDAGLNVTSVPGASSVITALTLAGLPTDRFLFLGFLPPKQGARRTALDEIRNVKASLVVLETPSRLAKVLKDMADILGNREAAVTRELTKKFEEVRRAPLRELAEHYVEANTPRGEVVLVIGPPGDNEKTFTPEEIDEQLIALLAKHRVKDVATMVSQETGIPRRDLYARAQELKDNRL
jgi:16S rRNA (cytidine1402-2'-O)-methyltransferase